MRISDWRSDGCSSDLLADALIMCRARYGSTQSVALVETWMKAIRRAAYLASSELAAEKGAFPLYDSEKYLAGETVGELDEDVREAIAAHGIRNALLTPIEIGSASGRERGGKYV